MTPQQQQQYASMAAGVGAGILLFGVLITAFLVFLFWRSFAKAGLSGPLSLLVLIPGIGFLVALCILAFSEWKVVPASAVSNLPHYPPSGYPATTNYPPSGPTQL